MSGLSDLERFRADGAAPSVRPASDDYLYLGTILAIDQSIANSGWVYVVSAYIEGEWGFDIRGAGNIRTEGDATGHEDTLRRVVTVYEQYVALIQAFTPSLIVHELPPVGSHMARPESSLCSASALRIARCNHAPDTPIRMVAAQRAKKVITGNGNAKKAQVRDDLLKVIPGLTGLKPRNEGIIDATALAWVAVREEK